VSGTTLPGVDGADALAGTAATGPATGRAARPVAVQVQDAAVRVGGRPVWSGVSATVRAGQFAAVLGPNGVGKSTLVRVILGVQPVAAGTVQVLGGPPGRARGAVGYLPQRRAFDPGLRIRGVDVVRLGVDGHRWGLPLPGRRSRAAAARVEEVIALVGASAYATRPIGQLSGGEQQRLLIAQALAPAPRLLLLDEPLDSLDLPNQSAVAALIARICTEQQIAVLMVAHDVNPILGYLDQVIYLARAGAASGPPTEVITTQTLSRLYGTPVEVLRASDGRLVVVGQPEPPALHTDRHQP
jgi:zinc/manganese transport system ATP-binding protein